MHPLFFPFLLIFELWLLIKIGAEIGALLAIILLFVSTALGLNLLRHQGINTLMKVNQKMNLGEDPSREAIEGIMLAISGALFLFPGFATDIAALVCLFPPTRYLLANRILKLSKTTRHMRMDRYGNIYEEDVIEGEYREVKSEVESEVESEDKRLR